MAKNQPAAETETAEAATRDMVIAGVQFTVSTPFAEGHVMTAAEAKQLNQTRCEGISNNMRKKVQELASEDGTFTDEALAKAAELVAAYDAEYTFTLSSGAGRKAIDPLDKECLAIARAQFSALVKAAGKKVKDIDAETANANIERFAADPQVIELAKKRLAERKEMAGGLSLTL